MKLDSLIQVLGEKESLSTVDINQSGIDVTGFLVNDSPTTLRIKDTYIALS